jgi:hypothetical protein
VGDTRAALVLVRADQLEVRHAGVVEVLDGQSEAARVGTPAGTAEGDAAVCARRLLEVTPGPGIVGTHRCGPSRAVRRAR